MSRTLTTVFALIAALLLGGLLATQIVAASPRASVRPQAADQPTLRTITVSGMGRATARPDVVQTTIGVESAQSTLKPATDEVAQKMASVVDALKKAGVADKDIRTTGISVQPQQSFNQGQPGPITGYRVSNNVAVTIRNVDQAGDVLDKAIQAGANQIYGLTFTIADQSAIQAEARTRAMIDASQHADTLARAAGVRIVSVQAISEGGASAPIIQRSAQMAAAPALQAGAGAGPVEAGELEVNVSVQVTYVIQ